MPVYKYNGDTYNIPQEKQQEFEKEFPEASISYMNGADQYDIPVGKREDFLKDFPNAKLYDMQENIPQKDGVLLPEINQEPNPTLEEPKTSRGFMAGVREGWKGLSAGIQNLWGEGANFFTRSSQEDANALYTLDEMLRQGKNVQEEVHDAWTTAGRELRTGAMEFLPGWMIKGWKNKVQNEAERQKILSDIRNVLTETGGDVAKARELLTERSQDYTYGDRQIQAAAERFADINPTEGVGAWIGSNAVQMIPSASALIVAALTKSPAAARAIGGIGMGTMTAATAGSSMYEARQAGADDYKTWKVGVVDGAIEYITERLPFDRYTKRLFGKAKSEVTKEFAEAVASKNSPARKELEELLIKANERLGGRLFSKRNLNDYMTDILAEGASEFSAEALQTMTSMMYEDRENYPTLGEIVGNGLQGALAGVFMGSVLGGASKTMEHVQNRARRKEQGYVDVAVVDFEGEPEVVEVVAIEGDKAVVLKDGEPVTVDAGSIGQGYSFTYEEFENARMRQIEDEAVEGGTVTDGMIQAAEKRTASAKERFEIALDNSGLSDEVKAQLREEAERGVRIPTLPEVSEAMNDYINELQRGDTLTEARTEQIQQKKQAVRDELTAKTGGQFWKNNLSIYNENGPAVENQTVEFGTLTDGRKVYILSDVSDTGEAAAVTEDGQKLFVTNEMLPEGTQIMPIDDYLSQEVEIRRAATEQERIASETASRIEETKASAQPGTQINLGTAEAPVLGQIIQQTADGVMVQTEAGVSQLTWEETANALGVGSAPMTDAEIVTAEASEIQDAESQWKETQAQSMQQEVLAQAENSEAIRDMEDSQPLPVKADGSVDQTALWNQSPERWARWNDEQRQDGGVNSINYINNALAKAQKDLDQVIKAYDKESDFDARTSLENDIKAKQERVARLTALQQSYIPQEAIEQAQPATIAAAVQPAKQTMSKAEPQQPVERTVEGEISRLFDMGLDMDEVMANLAARLAKSQKELEKKLKDAPKMGEDAEAYVAEKREHQQQLSALQQEVDFWTNAKNAIDNLKAQQVLMPNVGNGENANDQEPQNAVEFAASMLGLKEGGIKLLWESFKQHTGYSEGERSRYFGLFRTKANGGMTLEQAGERLMEMDREYNLGFFDQNDANAGLDAILDALSENETVGQLRSYVERQRQAEAQRETEAAVSSIMSDYEQTFGMSMEEAAAYDEVMSAEVAQKALTEREYYDYNNKFAEEISDYDTGTEEIPGRRNDEVSSDVEGGSEEASGRGSEVLQPAQTVLAGGEEEAVGSEQSEPYAGEVLQQDGASQVQDAAEGEQAVAESSLEGDMPDFTSEIEQARAQVDTEPTEAQKEAGNYRKGHIRIDGYDITIENPKGSVRKGTDSKGNQWENILNNDYGYIRGTEGVDGDHIDVYLSDNPAEGNVYVIDQINPDTQEFDEHKVMYGFNSAEEAREAYLANFSEGWNGLGVITEVSKDEFKKWIESSHRKTKPFSEYKSVKAAQQSSGTEISDEEATRGAIELFSPTGKEENKKDALRARVNEWEQKLGVPVKVMESIDDVTNTQAKALIKKGGKVWGWYETGTNQVYIYLPDFASLDTEAGLSEIDKTYIHEIVSHQGLRGLLGQEKYDELCDKLWESLSEEEKKNAMARPGVNGDTRKAADEHIAYYAETVNYETNPSAWDKIVSLIRSILTSIGVQIGISENDLASLLRASYQKLATEAQGKTEAEKLSLEDYLGRLGLSSPISDYMDDKLRNPHGLSKSQRNQLEKEAAAASEDYQKRRSAAIAEYDRLVSEGKIVPASQIDKLLVAANGHPDNAATQAARRSLEKRGYDWQTGQKKSAEVKTEPEKASKTIKAEKANDEKIEDFGEKIGGARKDVARAKIRDSVKLTTKDLVELKDPDKILSRKNIIKYYSEGVMTFEDAVKLLAMNMAVRGRDTIDRGVAMKKYRNLAMAWESGAELIVEITDEDVQDRMNEYSERMRQTPDFEKKTREGLELFVLKVYNDYKATYEALNYPEMYRNLKSAYIRYGDHDGKFWVVAGPSAYRGWPFPTLEQAVAKIEKVYPVETAAKKPAESKKDGEKSSSIHVTKDRAGYYRIKSRNIPGEIYLSGKLYSKKDAEAYLDENLDKLVERENRLLEALLGSNIGMVEREGIDYRKGKDVTPKDFLDTFGFRGVEFGNWVPQVERQAYLNKTYDAIMDFCRIVGISPKAFSLGGRLGLAFGSRGKSRALAHYEPLKEVINLTRMKGAGSLAHEWFHALDNYLAKQRSGNTSDMTTDNKPAVRQEVTDAFNAFVSAMNRLAYTRRSNRAGQYWGEVWERAARLFESYIYNELGGQNIVSPLLVKKDTLYVDHGEFSDDAWPYPSAEENEQMKPYFDRLFSTLQEQVEEDGSVALFRAEGADRKQAQFDVINETNPMTDDYHVGIRKVEDIKTFDEVMEAARRESEEGGWPELASYPDIENSLLEDALETRRIVIYSSHPISNGTFVTPSYMQADEYSGMTGEVYSKEVSVDDIAWINTDEGQYASLNDATDRYDGTPDDDIRFRASNENQAIFVSNAASAVEAIKMEKATPEQWLKMIEKNGGLKAGEDKWMGLSDWLKASDKKTLTKAEVLDFINENMIVIEEQHYSEGDDSLDAKRQEIQEALQVIYDEYVAESEDMNDDMFMKTHYDYAIQKLADELGYTAFNAPFINNNALIELDFHEDDLDTLHELNNRLGLEKYDGTRDINDTRLGYTTEGLTDRHEIALTVPTIESWGETDNVHFGDAGEGRAVAWVRFGDTRTYAKEYSDFYAFQEQMQQKYFPDRRISALSDSDLDSLTAEEKAEFERLRDIARSIPMKERTRRRVLVIDEIQSKRHQEGREKGYANDRIVKINKRLSELADKTYGTGLSQEEYEERKKLREELNSFPVVAAHLNAEYDLRDYERLTPPSKFNEERYQELKAAYDQTGEALRRAQRGIPDAPFDKNWHELAMKRMLRYAAENGYDVVAWTKGDQQAERYNIGSYVSSIEMQEEYDGKRDFGFYMGDADEATTVTVDENGTVVSAEGHLSQAEGRPLADLVGKDMAVKMMQMEEYDVLEDTDLKVGNEGMKGFYDKMLPAFMNKYGKKWGIKVEDITLPNVEQAGRVMHSVPVTEDMKASVMEGQTMFRARGEDESAREFTDSIIDDFKTKYTTEAEIISLNPKSRQEISDFIGIPADEITDEDLSSIVDDIESKNGYAWHDSDNHKIAIFVREDVKDSKVPELVLIHENIHEINSRNEDLVALGEYLWNKAEEGTKEYKYKVKIQERYPQDKWHDEMSAYVVSEHMQDGTLDKLEYLLDIEHSNILKKLLDKSGYGKERAQQRPRITWNVLRERYFRKSEESRKEEEGGNLTAEERRAINELFPETFEEEGSSKDDIRFRITPEQDKAYMDAIEAGDMDTAQRMVIEAARLAGYDSNSDYQGSLAFNGAAPSGHAYYDTKEERIEAWENGNMEDDQTLGDYKDAGVDISNLGWNLTSPVARRMGNEYTRESIKNLADAINNDSRKIKIYRAVDANIKEDSIRNGDWVTPSRAYAEYHIGLQDWKEGRIIEQEVDIDDIWWDGNDINEWGYNDGKGYAYKNTANNRKLLAPVTYDNNGNVIPLSERFNGEKEDIRFRAVTDPAKIEELENGPKIKVYRAMQLIDGKLYPPMSAKVDGKLREPIKLGQWEEAEERPDLVDNKGNFKLDKANKSSVPARYNPYFHTSRTPLNDQFSSAQTRPNLVTVEVEIPESELTSGYKAQKAKDSVGEKEWKAGIIQGKLTGTRKVILSRWDKPVRIVPDSEVADRIVEMFEGRNITMPSNVVTPSLRTELEKRGVPFVETDNQGRPMEAPTLFRSTGTPTDDVVAKGLTISEQKYTELAGDIYEALPEDIRSEVVDETFRNGMNMQSAIFQIPTRLAETDNLSDEEVEVAKMIAGKLQDALLSDGAEMTRPLTTSEALWMLYRRNNTDDDILSVARRSVAADNLGFSDAVIGGRFSNEDDIRFRAGRQAQADSAAKLYNTETRSAWRRLQESWQDMNVSVDGLMRAIEKASSKTIQAFEDVAAALNRLASKNLADKKKFMFEKLQPLWLKVLEISDKFKMKIEDIERYMMLKHGLERNLVLAARDARNFYKDELDKALSRIDKDSSLSKAEKKAEKIKAEAEYNRHVQEIQNGTDSKYQENRKKDYGGLTALFSDYADYGTREDYDTEEEYQAAALAARTPKYKTLAETERAAESEVKVFENKVGGLSDELWKTVNAATKDTLKHQYNHGMLSKEQYESVRDMFKYYVPLRGFKDNTVEDMYSYYSSSQLGKFSKPLQAAKGRKTEAESPLGWIGSMAESAIQMDNKNDAKLRLYYLAVNRPDNDLLKITETWYEWTGERDADGKKIFEPVYPTFAGHLSGDAMQSRMDAFDSMMEQQAMLGNAFRGKQKLDIKGSVIRMPKTEPEHIVTVKVAGKDYSILINGNPRAAQAINGLLNIDKADDNAVYRGFRAALRLMSSLSTSYNPEFWISNFQRDIMFAFLGTSIRNDAAYTKEFAKNYAKAFKVVSMLRKNKAGKLGNSEIENYYREFSENGGITGFTVFVNNTEYDKMLREFAKDQQKSDFVKKLKGGFEAFADFGEAIEQISRFAAYMTARKMGKGIEESVNEAKEVTVNFNRKGSGKAISWEESAQLRDRKGKPLNWAERAFFVMASGLSPIGRSMYMFFNASIQGLRTGVKLAKENPKKSAAWAGIFLTMGMLNAVLHAMLDDDDDYLDMPDYEKRTNLLVGGNGVYFKWALPQEVRPFYAMADIFVNHALARSPHKNITEELAGVFADLLPVNAVGAEGLEGVVGSLMPSYLSPIYELIVNKDFKGSPIYREMPWIPEQQQKYIPGYTKAYASTGSLYVDVSEMLNNLSGGTYAKAGRININPAAVEHIIEGYGGGTLTTANKLLKSLGMIAGTEEVTVRSMPFLSRLLTINDERYRNAHTTELFNYYKGISDQAKREYGSYKKQKDSKNITRLLQSEEWKVHQIFVRYKKMLEYYDKQLKLASSEEERRMFMQEQDAQRKRVIKEISELR